MSVFRAVELACPGCARPVRVELVASVNLDRSPALRRAIVDESFQREICPDCGTSFRIDPRFALIDHGRQRWIAALPLARRPHWAGEERTAQATFERAYGAQASPTIGAIGATLRRRVTFGWAGLREKLLCDELGIADLTLELLKTAVLASAASAPLGRASELRLDGQDGQGGERLRLAWLRSSDEQPLEWLHVQRAALAQIEADAGDAWAELRAGFDGALFVDIARLIITPTEDTP